MLTPHPERSVLLLLILLTATVATPLFGSVESASEVRDRAAAPSAREEISAPRTPPSQMVDRADTRPTSPAARTPESDPPVAVTTDTTTTEPEYEHTPEETEPEPAAPVPETPDDTYDNEPTVAVALEAEGPAASTDTSLPDMVDEPESEFAETFLTLHNEARAEYDLPPLVWSNELAEGATAWAEELADDHECELIHSDEPYGENLFSLWSSNGDVRGTPDDAMDWWVGEGADYDYDANACDDGAECGHYTQVVWENTTHLGCATTRCTDGSGATDLFVCRYDPPGNVIGERPY